MVPERTAGPRSDGIDTVPDEQAAPSSEPMRTEHSTQEKETALDIYQDRGLAAAHHATGIPRSTLHGWARAAGLDTSSIAGRTAEQTIAANIAREARCAELRTELREMLLSTAVDLLERIDQPHKEFKGVDAHEVEFDRAPAGAARDYATSAAILLDKYRLEVGEVTSRQEHHVDGDPRARAVALLDDLQMRRLRAVPLEIAAPSSSDAARD